MITDKDRHDAGIISRGLKIDGVEAISTVLASVRDTLATPASNGRLRELNLTLQRFLRQLREIEDRKATKQARPKADPIESDGSF